MLPQAIQQNASREELLRIVQELLNAVRELQREVLLLRNAIDIDAFGE